MASKEDDEVNSTGAVSDDDEEESGSGGDSAPSPPPVAAAAGGLLGDTDERFNPPPAEMDESLAELVSVPAGRRVPWLAGLCGVVARGGQRCLAWWSCVLLYWGTMATSACVCRGHPRDPS